MWIILAVGLQAAAIKQDDSGDSVAGAAAPFSVGDFFKIVAEKCKKGYGWDPAQLFLFSLPVTNWRRAYAFRMAAARIAILALFVSMGLTAESPSKISVKVTDPSGSPIPHARVQSSTSESGIIAEALTDAQGEAVLYLDPGTYTVSVSAQSFKSWRRGMIHLMQNSSISIQADLRPGDMGSGFVVNDEKTFRIEYPLLAASIPLEPLASLVDLPRRKLWHHFRSHVLIN